MAPIFKLEWGFPRGRDQQRAGIMRWLRRGVGHRGV